ncbi:ricin-type beta-trefoil lectin domain protein [Streptomyces sp. NPDC001941]|uniref:ricin-type beta-trefoil lectin domain protein n=1 Tax=Streptomyces sp. NPDC001941 TaxID=3154659 RepID=UPI003327D592
MNGVDLVKEPRSDRRRCTRRLPAVVVAAALGVGALAAGQPAFAVTQASTDARDAAETDTKSDAGNPDSAKAKTSSKTPTPAESKASREAAKTGKQVEVTEQRDEHTQVLANPDGTFAFKQYVRPEFARTDAASGKGGWQKADATLRYQDGRITPKAPVFGLSFSAGGDAPLATMTKAGKELSLSWPKPLPKPTLEGSDATYAEVLPGVDLKILAETDGFAQHLVVKTREAAQNPELAELNLKITEKGLDVQADAAGNLSAKDTSGESLFTAPTPAMWDSSHLTQAERAKALRGQTPKEEAPPAKLTDMATEVDGDTLRITPDAVTLRAQDTVYPVTIDPIFSGGGRINWALAYKQSGNSSLAGTPYWNGGSFKDKLARVGHETDTGGTSRAYFQLDIKGLKGADITSATFNAFNSYAWSCTKTPVELGWTGAINSSTTWNKQPAWNRTLQEKTFAHGWSSTSCPSAGEDFKSEELRKLVHDVAQSGSGDLTLGLRSRSDYETKNTSWKKFHNNPHLEVIYNHPPKVDNHVFYQGAYVPGGSGNQQLQCSADPATWPTVGKNDLTLTAKVSDPDGGNIWARFQVWEYAGPSHSESRPQVAAGNTAQMSVKIQDLVDGKRYKWHVRAEDGVANSAYSAQCGFNVAKSTPEKPVVTSADEHPLDVASVPARHDRKVTFTSKSASGLDGFCYTLNKPLSVSNAKCANGTFVAAGKDGKATVTIKPSLWPQNKLHVQAYDKAGNTSGYDGHGEATDVTHIATKRPDYVHDEHGRVHGDLPGDLDGDGYVDMLAVDNDGHLRHYKGTGDGMLTGDAQSIVDRNGGWKGAEITHRGDFTGPTGAKDGYEDYFVKLGNKLYLYPGDGNGMPLEEYRQELFHPTGKNSGRLKLTTGGKCVVTQSTNGSPLVVGDCKDGDDQRFELTEGELKVLGKCVATTSNGDMRAPLELRDCNGTSAQQWQDRGDRSLVNPASGRCVDQPAAGQTNGTKLQTYDCNRTSAQTWDVPGSWSDAGQILAPGNADGKTGNDLIVREGKDLVLYSGTTTGPLAMEPGTHKLKPGHRVGGGVDWSQYDVTAPGDIDGDGVPDLLARHITSDSQHADYGKLYLFKGKHANGSYELGERSVYGSSAWQRGNIRLLTSAGNAQGEVVDMGSYKKFVPTEGQETPDYWAVTTAGDGGDLRFYAGRKEDHAPAVRIGGGWNSIASIH